MELIQIKTSLNKLRKTLGRITGFLKQYSDIIFRIYLIFTMIILVIPVTVFSYSVFEDLQVTEKSKITWEEGSNSTIKAKLRIDIGILSIDIENRSFDLQFYLRKGIWINETAVTNEDIKILTLTLDGSPNNIVDFTNFSRIEFSSYIRGNIKYFPLDFYRFSFDFTGLEDINITDYQQIHLNVWCADENWKVRSLNGNFLVTEDEPAFSMFFDINRESRVVFFQLLLPLTIFGGIIFLVFIATRPWNEKTKEAFLRSNKDLSPDSSDFLKLLDEFEKEVDFDRKFRIDAAKWLLAFSVANILFSPVKYDLPTIQSFYSAIALVWSFAFYGSSKYQGKGLGVVFNTGIGFTALVLELSILFQLLLL